MESSLKWAKWPQGIANCKSASRFAGTTNSKFKRVLQVLSLAEQNRALHLPTPTYCFLSFISYTSHPKWFLSSFPWPFFPFFLHPLLVGSPYILFPLAPMFSDIPRSRANCLLHFLEIGLCCLPAGYGAMLAMKKHMLAGRWHISYTSRASAISSWMIHGVVTWDSRGTCPTMIVRRGDAGSPATLSGNWRGEKSRCQERPRQEKHPIEALYSDCYFLRLFTKW